MELAYDAELFFCFTRKQSLTLEHEKMGPFLFAANEMDTHTAAASCSSCFALKTEAYSIF